MARPAHRGATARGKGVVGPRKSRTSQFQKCWHLTLMAVQSRHDAQVTWKEVVGIDSGGIRSWSAPSRVMEAY